LNAICSDSFKLIVRRGVFWFRYFGLTRHEVPCDQFCQAFWLHLTYEFDLKTPPLDQFTKMMIHVLGACFLTSAVLVLSSFELVGRETVCRREF